MSTRSGEPIFSRAVYESRSRIRERFEDNQPLTNFVVIPDLLSAELLELARVALRQADFRDFCGHTSPEEPDIFRNEFFEPVDGHRYVTIHQRPIKDVPELDQLHQALASQAALATLEELTGISLSSDGHRSVLTGWGPWSFLAPHTDSHSKGKPNRLILSLSLTREWERRFGGATKFQWSSVGPTVMVPPVANTAVLFMPFEGSTHWVEQISGDAPDRLRYTWTMEYA